MLGQNKTPKQNQNKLRTKARGHSKDQKGGEKDRSIHRDKSWRGIGAINQGDETGNKNGTKPIRETEFKNKTGSKVDKKE